MVRRLVAVMAADMVGYSRLMAADELGTISRQKSHRKELIDPMIAKHDGRLVKTTGDGMLLEFPSVVEAVQCAVEIQQAMPGRESKVPETKRIQYRIGVNLGDVVIDGDDILGDGVNIAARLEGIAEPGGVCVSDVVYQNIQGKLEFAFDDLGEMTLKNMDRKVRAWSWLDEKCFESGEPESITSPQTLPEKPSIAVLPFDNLSGDPEQDYFAHGIAEDIITGLSKNQWLLVIARNSSFVYLGEPVDIRRVGHELGVRYVLEGSVRRGGDRVRVNAQLIESQTTHHVWADHYDGNLDDVFELQDQITARILSALGPELTMAEVERSRQRRSKEFEAWDLYLRALPYAYEITEEGFERAVKLLNQAIERDPNYSSSYATLCYCYSLAAYHAWTSGIGDAIRQSIEYGDKALALDPLNPTAQANLGWAHVILGPQEKASRILRRALELNPNSTVAWAALGMALGFMGEPEQAMEATANAKRGSPRDPLQWQWFLAEGIAHFAADRLEKSLEAAQVVVQLQPKWYGAYPLVAASAAHMGRKDTAHEAISTLLKLIPRFSMKSVERNPMFERSEDAKRMIDGLRLAGLPE